MASLFFSLLLDVRKWQTCLASTLKHNIRWKVCKHNLFSNQGSDCGTASFMIITFYQEAMGSNSTGCWTFSPFCPLSIGHRTGPSAIFYDLLDWVKTILLIKFHLRKWRQIAEVQLGACFVKRPLLTLIDHKCPEDPLQKPKK